MRIVLQVVEFVLYMLALFGFVFGFVFGVVIIVIAKKDDPGTSELRAATTVAAIYLAMPPFILGAVGLAGGAALTAIDRLRQER